MLTTQEHRQRRGRWLNAARLVDYMDGHPVVCWCAEAEALDQ